MKIKWEVNTKLWPLDGNLIPGRACVAHWSCQAAPLCLVHSAAQPAHIPFPMGSPTLHSLCKILGRPCPAKGCPGLAAVEASPGHTG